VLGVRFALSRRIASRTAKKRLRRFSGHLGLRVGSSRQMYWRVIVIPSSRCRLLQISIGASNAASRTTI
jgi:hypothetical protein